MHFNLSVSVNQSDEEIVVWKNSKKYEMIHLNIEPIEPIEWESFWETYNIIRETCRYRT